MVRGCNPHFGDADVLELTLTTGCRSVNAKEVCKCGKVAVCNAANHCLVRLSVCLSENCEPDGACRKVLAGFARYHVIFLVALPSKLQPTASLSKRALGKGRQGKARQLFSLRSINRPLLPPTSPSLQHDTTNTTLPPDVRLLSANSIHCFALATTTIFYAAT